MKSLRSVLYIFVASIALLAQTALADFITPVGVIASGRMSDPENMIDESGMRVSGNRNDYPNWSSLPATKDTWHEETWFATTHSPGPWTTLDLGSVCDLETISIWSCNPGSDGPYQRSATKLDVYVRKDLDRNNTHENLAAFNPAAVVSPGGPAITSEPAKNTARRGPRRADDQNTRLQAARRDPAILFARRGPNNDGFVTLEEFIGDPSNRNVPALTKLFRQRDANHDERLTLEELKGQVEQ